MSCSKRKKKILFVIYSDPMIYPPTMNAAEILSDNGWEVDIVGIRVMSGHKIKCPPGVRIHYFGKEKRGVSLRLQFLLFNLWIIKLTARNAYSFVFAYDFMAVIPAYLAAKISRCPWCYHNHDLMETQRCKGFYFFLKKAELRLAKKTTLVIFPQKERAKLFASEARLVKDTILVFNAPRKKWATTQKVHPELQKLKQKFKKIILYQGCLSSDFQLDKLLMALSLCHSDFGLCLVGKELEYGIREKFIEQAKELGIKQRIIILPLVPYDELPSITAFCDIGIAKLSEENSGAINDFLLAGASNKIAEYMAFGLPILAPDTDPNRRFIENGGHGLVCKVEPKFIADCIDKLYKDKKLYNKIKFNNINYFNKKLNYDVQFEKVLNIINSCID